MRADQGSVILLKEFSVDLFKMASVNTGEGARMSEEGSSHIDSTLSL